MYDLRDDEVLKMLSRNENMKRAYICSPLFDEKLSNIKNNMEMARIYMIGASDTLDVVAKAPHAYLPLLLCDSIPGERALAIKFGIDLLEHCDMLLVCGGRLTNGMKGEIHHALSLKMPVIVFNNVLFKTVQKYAQELGYDGRNISYDENYGLGGS